MLGPGIFPFMEKISLYLPSPVLTLFFQLCVKTFLLNIIMYPQEFRVHMCPSKGNKYALFSETVKLEGQFFGDE